MSFRYRGDEKPKVGWISNQDKSGIDPVTYETKVSYKQNEGHKERKEVRKYHLFMITHGLELSPDMMVARNCA